MKPRTKRFAYHLGNGVALFATMSTMVCNSDISIVLTQLTQFIWRMENHSVDVRGGQRKVLPFLGGLSFGIFLIGLVLLGASSP